MSFSSDDEFDIPLPDIDLAALDLSSYNVVPTQSLATLRPQLKQERIEEDWDLPIRVGQDGSYGLRVSPVKPLAPPPLPVKRPAPPPPPQLLRPPPPQQDIQPPQSQGFPLSQAAEARRAAVLAYAAAPTTGQPGRGQSVPPARPIGGFSQRPATSAYQRATSAVPSGGGVGGVRKVNHFAPPASQRTFARTGSSQALGGTRGKSPTPGPVTAAGGGTINLGGDFEFLKKQNEELLKALKSRENEVYTAAGEASMLRRKMEEEKKQSEEMIQAMKAQWEAKEEKQRKKEEERRSEEETRRAKAVLDNHNAATYSIRRPTALPPSSLNWGTQSVLRSRSRPSATSQRRQPAQTPAPLGRTTSGRELLLNGASPKSSPRGSPRTNGERSRPPLPPVPKFPSLKNSFIAFGSKTGRKGNAQRSPSKAPEASISHDERLAKRSQTEEYEGGMDAGLVDEPNDARGGAPAEEEETTPIAAPRRIAVETSSPVPDSDDVEPVEVMEGVEEAAREDVLEEVEDEDEFWKPEDKDLLLAVLFNHQVSPLSPPSVLPTQTQLSAPSPSTPSTLSFRSATFQALLAPLDSQGPATARDRTEHQRSSNRMMGALSGALKPALSAGDVVLEVMKGLQAMAKLFERLNMIHLLTQTLLLVRSLVLHVPRTGRVLLRLPSLTSLISSIKDRHFPAALLSKGKAPISSEGSVERLGKIGVTKAMLNVLEAVVWQAEGQADADVLANLVQLPNLLSGLLNSSAQPPEVLTQTVRILLQLSFFESLFRPLLSFPDHNAQVRHRDATRIPLVELLCKLLRDSPQIETSGSPAMALDIVSIFRTICYKHQDEAVLLFTQQRALTPTVVICLERCASAIWGVDVGMEQLRRSIPPLNPLLHLLSLLTSPEESAISQTLNLADRLRSAPKSDFPAAFERFMVAFGRICYAEVPDLEEMAAWSDEGDGKESWRIWEGELERAGDIARDIFDQVVEGPEGDLVYGVFVLEVDDEAAESLSSSIQHIDGPEEGAPAPPASSQPMGPLMPEDDGQEGSETEEEEEELPPLKSQRTARARAVPRQEVVKRPPVKEVDVVELLSDSDGD